MVRWWGSLSCLSSQAKRAAEMQSQFSKTVPRQHRNSDPTQSGRQLIQPTQHSFINTLYCSYKLKYLGSLCDGCILI